MSARLLLLGLALVGACDRRDAGDLEHATADPTPPPAATPAPDPAPPADPAASPVPEQDPATDLAPAPGTTAAPAAVPAPLPTLATIPPERRCGEAGEQPTELPPDLAHGRAPAGKTTLRPGDKRTIGKTQLHYDRDAWIGTRRSGHRGPALLVEIDRAEVGPHDPWGTHQDLHPDSELHTFVGPYRFDIRTGAGDPPATVAVTVSREVCPPVAQFDRTDATRSLWVSTEGIRTHNYDLSGEFLQFNLDAMGNAPRLDINNLGYRHWFEPHPDSVRSIRVGQRLVTVDRVIPGPGTRFDGAWKASGDARLHARLRIDPAVAAPHPAPVAATSECGDSSVRTTVPAALGKKPAVAAPRTVALGKELTLGPLTFKYITFEIPERGRGPYREEAQQIPMLQIFGGQLGGQTVSNPRTSPATIRLGKELVHVDGDGDRARLRHATLACLHQHNLPALQAPIYLWLSALGRTYVTVPGSGTTPLSLQLHVSPSGPSLAFGSEHAFLSHQLRPDAKNLAYTFDDHLVEVVDIVPGPDTSHDGQRWQSTGLLPVVHVQLKITPQPVGP
ncbi:hypothetical protein [Nannocystis radixulma]|uniref:Lipoprotein n=1 Tax=Nannocystis radixulma TaxID=2995305 RepID=A0ABT5BFX8_9BACT|nr:hypothetical protein [Nannocystis radixulma]MDC0673033.1 hypothetical protein [Nannocystis radixulma]